MEQLTRGCPEEFSRYVQYCKNLNFEEKPDYNFMRQIFRGLMQASGYEHDGQYDWVLKKEGKTNELRQQQMLEERKAPIAGRVAGHQPNTNAGLHHARASSKNL